jgi:hypothetical protein
MAQATKIRTLSLLETGSDFSLQINRSHIFGKRDFAKFPEQKTGLFSRIGLPLLHFLCYNKNEYNLAN